MLYFLIILVIIHLVIEIRKAIYIMAFKSPIHNPEFPSFSIIVAAHNEAGNLKGLIPKLLEQQYDPYEIIIVLDRCKDQSKQVVEAFTSPRLRSIVISDLPTGVDGKKYALEKGIIAAKNEWILLTDADCKPASSDWVRSFAHSISSQTQIVLGVSPYNERPGLLNAFIRYETLQTALFYIGSALEGIPYMGVGRNLAYSKSLFIRRRGFHTLKLIRGGDDDLFIQKNANKLNTNVVLKPESLTYSAAKRSWKTYFIQKTRHLSVGKHYRSKLKIILSFRSAVHLLIWPSFLYLIVKDSAAAMAIGILCSMFAIKGYVFDRVAKKMGLSLSIFWLPIVDFLYVGILPVIGIRSAFVKNVRWK